MPEFVMAHDAVTLVQAVLLLVGAPLGAFLTTRLCEENGFSPLRQAMQLGVQLALVAELWHLAIR